MANTDTISPELSTTQQADKEYHKFKDVRKADKEVALDLIDRLLTRGIKSPTEIQKSLEANTPPVYVKGRTLFRYIATVKRRHHEEVKAKIGINQTVEESAYNLKKTIEEVLRELWKQYHAPVIMDAKCFHCDKTFTIRSKFSAQVKVQALKEIREGTQELLKTMQSLGLVHKAPETHQVLGPDGKPIDPGAAEKVALNQTFIAFIKATYQDPVGAGNEPDSQKQVDE